MDSPIPPQHLDSLHIVTNVESLINYISENDVDGFDKFYQEFNSYINSIYN